MSLQTRLADLERRRSGKDFPGFTRIDRAGDVVHLPDGSTVTLAEYEAVYPDWRQTSWTFKFSKPGDDRLLGLVDAEDDEELD